MLSKRSWLKSACSLRFNICDILEQAKLVSIVTGENSAVTWQWECRSSWTGAVPSAVCWLPKFDGLPGYCGHPLDFLGFAHLFIFRWIYLNDQNLCIPASSSFVYGAVPIGASIYVIGDLDTGKDVVVILLDLFPGDSKAPCITFAASYGLGTNYDYVREFKRSTGTWHHTKPLLPSDLRRTGCAALRIANCKLFRLQLQQGLFRIRVHSPWGENRAEAELLTKRTITRLSARGTEVAAETCSVCRALYGNSGGFTIMLRSLSFHSRLGEPVTVEKANLEESVPPVRCVCRQTG